MYSEDVEAFIMPAMKSGACARTRSSLHWIAHAQSSSGEPWVELEDQVARANHRVLLHHGAHFIGRFGFVGEWSSHDELPSAATRPSTYVVISYSGSAANNVKPRSRTAQHLIERIGGVYQLVTAPAG